MKLFFTLEGHHARLYGMIEELDIEGVPSISAVELLESGGKGSTAIIPKENVLPTPNALRAAFFATSDWTGKEQDQIEWVIYQYDWLLQMSLAKANQRGVHDVYEKLFDVQYDGEYRENDFSKCTVLELFAISYHILRDLFSTWLPCVEPTELIEYYPGSWESRELTYLTGLINTAAGALEGKIGRTAYGIGDELIRLHAGDYLRWAKSVFNLITNGRLDVLHDAYGFYPDKEDTIKELMDGNWRPQYTYLPRIFGFAEDYNRENEKIYTQSNPPNATGSEAEDDEFLKALEELGEPLEEDEYEVYSKDDDVSPELQD